MCACVCVCEHVHVGMCVHAYVCMCVCASKHRNVNLMYTALHTPHTTSTHKPTPPHTMCTLTRTTHLINLHGNRRTPENVGMDGIDVAIPTGGPPPLLPAYSAGQLGVVTTVRRTTGVRALRKVGQKVQAV